MIYAINKWTKEHRVVNKVYRFGNQWERVQADDDGWIKWEGEECPLPDGTPYETKHESGAMFEGGKPETFRIHWRGDGDAVVAYRPIIDEPEQARFCGNLLWQDAEGTIPARDGDPVGRIDCDMTGNAIWSTGSGRPVYTKPEPPEWDGEGLPPVGCECEWKHKRASDDQWVSCQIVGYHDEWVFVVDGANSGMPAVKKAATWRFRPIRTPTQQAEDEAMEEMLAIIENAESAADCCQALYRAGYRKEEE